MPHDDPTTHAPNGWVLTLPPLKGSQIRDGSCASFRTDAQRHSDLQRLSKQNISDADAMRESSLDISRNFHNEEESPGETPSPARGSVDGSITDDSSSEDVFEEESEASVRTIRQERTS
jgi:hypothetical protein